MRPGLFGLPVLFLTAMLAAYAAPEAQKLVLTGSSTIAPLAAELARSGAARAIVEQQFFVPVDARPVNSQPVDGQPADAPVDAR